MRTEADLIQNLRDAGCPEELIGSFMELYGCGRVKDGLRLLQQHRRSLLDSVHEEERKINCLDYMVYHLEKEN